MHCQKYFRYWARTWVCNTSQLNSIWSTDCSPLSQRHVGESTILYVACKYAGGQFVLHPSLRIVSHPTDKKLPLPLPTHPPSEKAVDIRWREKPLYRDLFGPCYFNRLRRCLVYPARRERLKFVIVDIFLIHRLNYSLFWKLDVILLGILKHSSFYWSFWDPYIYLYCFSDHSRMIDVLVNTVSRSNPKLRKTHQILAVKSYIFNALLY